jgi:hypothetical protein
MAINDATEEAVVASFMNVLSSSPELSDPYTDDSVHWAVIGAEQFTLDIETQVLFSVNSNPYYLDKALRIAQWLEQNLTPEVGFNTRMNVFLLIGDSIRHQKMTVSGQQWVDFIMTMMLTHPQALDIMVLLSSFPRTSMSMHLVEGDRIGPLISHQEKPLSARQWHAFIIDPDRQDSDYLLPASIVGNIVLSY